MSGYWHHNVWGYCLRLAAPTDCNVGGGNSVTLRVCLKSCRGAARCRSKKQNSFAALPPRSPSLKSREPNSRTPASRPVGACKSASRPAHAERGKDRGACALRQAGRSMQSMASPWLMERLGKDPARMELFECLRLAGPSAYQSAGDARCIAGLFFVQCRSLLARHGVEAGLLLVGERVVEAGPVPAALRSSPSPSP